MADTANIQSATYEIEDELKDSNNAQLVNSEDRQGVNFTRVLINNFYFSQSGNVFTKQYIE